MHQDLELANKVTELVLEKYNKLPSTGKPLVRTNGIVEWTILAGLVLESELGFECVSLATGVKALPETTIAQANGKVLHDMHAEILTIRALNRYLLDECRRVSQHGSSKWVRRKHGSDGFEAVPGLKLHLYISSPPCGDASMFLLQGESWNEMPPEAKLIRGRNHYNALGYIRTKPGRTDSILTMSKSCSDKLALRQERSLLLQTTSKVLDSSGFYLDTLVCPEIDNGAFERAFSRWPSVKRFNWAQTSLVFNHSQTVVPDGVPSGVSLLWMPGQTEVLNNGVRQGNKVLSGKGISVVSRYALAQVVLSLQNSSGFEDYLRWKDDNGSKFYPDGWVRTASDTFSIQ